MDTLDEIKGLKITDIWFEEGEDAVFLILDDDKKVKVSDNGQLCCERRYMTSDDTDGIGFLKGSNLFDIVVTGDTRGDEGGYGYVHAVQFLEIRTSHGVATLSNHNVHNGYYGGFGLVIAEVE
jgi:hypothetical protein